MSPLFRYPLKTTEKLWSSGIFRLYRKRVCAVLVSQLLTLSTFRLILSSRLYPVDTGRKLNVHKAFRRRPGRLLNVLCMLNLRPVSTGVLFLLKTLNMNCMLKS